MAWIEGEKVGGYTLGRQLGQGGMATVYLGHHPELDRQVAIKVMHQNFLEDAGFVARFKREAQIVAKLTHPHIVPVYDFSEHDGQPYLVMKYIQGWTLKKQLIKNPPDLDGILDIVTAIGDALNYAHAEGILHRDIKPSNIVIDQDNIPYLADFGLARLASSGESTMSADMLLGTPHYISPEQARGAMKLDGRTDIYSLGVVLYELLVGKVPFTGESAFSIIHDHIYTALPAPTLINPEIPQSVENVLYKALQKQPSERYETANDLISDLRQAIKQGNLTELDPNRATIAEISLAKLREAYDDQPTITPAIGSPIPSGSSVQQATLYPKAKPFYDQERFWTISGCGSLLLILFISFGILLGMSSNIQELSALSASVADELGGRFGIFAAAIDTIETSDNFGIEVIEIEGVPILDVPYVPLVDLPQDTNNIAATLLFARSFYEEDDFTQARERITENIPNEASIRAVYLLSAARMAANAGDDNAAVIYSILATELSRNQVFLIEEVRALSGRIIYENAITTADTSLRETLQNLRDREFISAEVLQQLTNSDLTAFATVRNLIANNNPRLAQTALNHVSEDVIINQEFALLRAELALQMGNQDNAEMILDDILDDGDTPNWVRDRAVTIQNELN